VPRRKHRPQAEVVQQCRALAAVVRGALDRLPEDESDPAVVDAVWRGEALGALLWVLGLVNMPAYDEPFDHAALLELDLDGGRIRDEEKVEHECETASLWHWRARTTLIQERGDVPLPEPWESYDQLIAATAMRGFEQDLLPPPMRGDFRAFGKVYRHLSPEQRSEALSIALERHHALNWACGLGKTWEEVPTDT
jgi:hypothetical protein